MLHRLNPHIVDPKQLHRDVGLRELGGYGNECRPYELARTRFLKRYDSAVHLLSGVSGLTEAFPDGLPLAYNISPVLKPATLPVGKGAKFGGIPSLQGLISFEAHRDRGPIIDHIAHAWPRCGCCHRHMRFICQLSFGPLAGVIHALTHFPSTHGLEYALSGIGGGKLQPSYIVDRWWYVFMCPQAGEHFHNPNFDAHILVDWRFRSMRDIFASKSEDDTASTKEKAQRQYRQQVLAATKSFMGDIGELSLEDQDSAIIPLQRVVGCRLGFDLDLDLHGMDTWDLSEGAEGVVDAHPEVFGKRGDYVFFGKPRSQQTERRPYCQNSYLGPTRMSPILNFTDENHDFSYQLYGDTMSIDHKDLYCKVDGSCT